MSPALRRAVRRARAAARALAFIALGFALAGWWLTDRELAEVQADRERLGAELAELREGDGRARYLEGVVRGTAVRLGIPEELLLTLGGHP